MDGSVHFIKDSVNLDTMPPVTNTATPIAQEVSAVADWLFSNVQWAKQAPDEETSIVGDDKKLRIHKISRPTLTVYLPDEDKATGAAVIICPGGGYTIAAFSHEGTQVAERFNEMGVAAFVLKYRIPDDKTMHDKTIGPLQDAQRAIQL